MLELIRMSSNMTDGNQRKHLLQILSVIEFCCKSVNLLLEELTNIKVRAKFLQKGHFFNLNDSSLVRHVNVASRKSLEIQVYSTTKPRNLLEQTFG